MPRMSVIEMHAELARIENALRAAYAAQDEEAVWELLKRRDQVREWIEVASYYPASRRH
jgi:hypothetical protein